MSSAGDLYIGISPPAWASTRAFAAIDMVHDKMRKMQASGGMKQVSSAFKACARSDTVAALPR